MRPKAPNLEFSSPAPSAKRHGARRGLLSTMCALAALSAALACMPPTPAQKATEAARELNMSARWGRMTEAMAITSPKERADWAKRHAEWHTRVRILETELTGLDMKDATTASVQVDVSWMFSDDPTLRVTRLKQEWSDAEGKWVMLSEERLSGDKGLFGEEVKKAKKRRDMHFPSRVIH